MSIDEKHVSNDPESLSHNAGEERFQQDLIKLMVEKRNAAKVHPNSNARNPTRSRSNGLLVLRTDLPGHLEVAETAEPELLDRPVYNNEVTSTPPNEISIPKEALTTNHVALQPDGIRTQRPHIPPPLHREATESTSFHSQASQTSQNDPVSSIVTTPPRLMPETTIEKEQKALDDIVDPSYHPANQQTTPAPREGDTEDPSDLKISDIPVESQIQSQRDIGMTHGEGGPNSIITRVSESQSHQSSSDAIMSAPQDTDEGKITKSLGSDIRSFTSGRVADPRVIRKRKRIIIQQYWGQFRTKCTSLRQRHPR
ncbi:hypothetical protein BP6252_07171 [Coleophoma cylindrospora]|uniref:Uncharacterized protein n=1 Tax=Coleophoma cylindrospora TaxID=1849047 RepID=A0A3D8RH99_9HELO|nr:hypothetical protein BP6252_07171 [Coleophoma cylindrospora]